jgi:Uma2 family endonuclease
MNIQLPVQMDQDTFLTWVQGRAERYELDRGRVIMMTGGSRAHWQITANLLEALRARLDPDCYAVLPEFGVMLETGSVRFPDIVIDPAGQPPTDLTATAPVMIVEVLSPSTERTDLGDKAAEYLRLPSLLDYVVIAQDEMKAWAWTRAAEGFAPAATVLEGADAVVRIDALEVDLPFAEIYARLRFG